MNDGRVLLPGGIQGELVELTMIASNTPGKSGSNHPVLAVSVTKTGHPMESIGLQESRWGACMEVGGTGWVRASCLNVKSPSYDDLLVIPFAKDLPTQSVGLKATSSTDTVSASAELGPDGAKGYVGFEQRTHAKGYSVTLRGSILEAPQDVILAEGSEPDSFHLKTVPDAPFIVAVFKRNMSIKWMTTLLQNTGLESGALVGNHGYGLFSASLDVRLPFFRHLTSMEYLNLEQFEKQDVADR